MLDLAAQSLRQMVECNSALGLNLPGMSSPIGAPKDVHAGWRNTGTISGHASRATGSLLGAVEAVLCAILPAGACRPAAISGLLPGPAALPGVMSSTADHNAQAVALTFMMQD